MREGFLRFIHNLGNSSLGNGHCLLAYDSFISIGYGGKVLNRDVFNVNSFNSIFIGNFNSFNSGRFFCSHKGRLFLRGVRIGLFLAKRRGFVSSKANSLIGLALSAAKLINVLSKKLFVLLKKLCNGIVNVIIIDINDGRNKSILSLCLLFFRLLGYCRLSRNRLLCHGLFRYSSSFFRSSSGFLRFLLFLGFCLWSSRLSLRCRHCELHWLGHRHFGLRSRCLWHRCGSRLLILGDLTVCDIIYLIGKDHAIILFLGLFLAWLFIIIGEGHFVFRLLIVTVKIIGIDGKNHIIFGLLIITVKIIGIDGEHHVYWLIFSGSFFSHGLVCNCLVGGSFFSLGLVCNCFFSGSLFSHGLICNSLISGSFFSLGLVCNSLISGSFFSLGLVCNCFFSGSFFSHGLICNSFINRSFFSHRLVCSCLISESFIFSFFLSLLVCQALFNLVKKVSSSFSSLSCFFLFLFDRFFERSFFFFFFSCDSSFLFSLFTLLRRSHWALLGFLFQLLSVVFSIFEGCLLFFVQALRLVLAGFARIAVSVIILTGFGIIATVYNAVFPCVNHGFRRSHFRYVSLIF